MTLETLLNETPIEGMAKIVTITDEESTPYGVEVLHYKGMLEDFTPRPNADWYTEKEIKYIWAQGLGMPHLYIQIEE